MDQLKEKGWNLTEEGFKKISENGAVNHVPTLIKIALNTDLRDIGASSFPTDSKSKFEVPKSGMVLQIMKIVRNIAAPKINQDSKFAPRLLKIQFTDGQNQFSGIEIEHISPLNLFDTKPGTKLFFRPGKVIQISQDLLLLRPSYFDVLGGHVKELVDKWEVAQRYSKYSTIRAVTQAPPWIAFGQKIDRKSLNVNKKSFAGAEKKDGEENKEDDAFDNQRKEAIAEAFKQEGPKRVFLDGAKKIVHHNVQKIVDKGFTEEQAKEALKYSRNDLGKALANLKRSGGGGGDDDEGDRFHRGGRGGGRGGRRGGGGRGRFGGDNEDSEEQFMAKPSEKISLFDFIGDKLPPEVKNATPAPPPPTSYNSGGVGGGNYRGQNSTNKFSGEGGKFPGGRDRERGGAGGHPRDSHNRHAEHSKPHHQHPPTFQQSRGPPHSTGGNPRGGNNRNERNNHSGPPQNHRGGGGEGRQSNYERGGGGGGNLERDMERMSLSNRGNNHQQSHQFNASNPHQRTHHNNHNNQRNHPPSLDTGFPNYDPRRTPGFLNTTEAANKFLQKEQQKQQHQQQPTLSQGGPQFQQNHRQRPPGNPHPESTSSWNWNIGDRCLAKYWEDGKYYNAEITGVSGRTCVVHFMEYGNFEEVAKDDCLPITA